MEGWLTKRGGSFKSWKKRYFVLSGYNLTYAKKPDAKPIDTLDIRTFTGIEAAPEISKKHAFKVGTPGRIYYIYAENDQVRDEWIAALARKEVGQSPTKKPRAESPIDREPVDGTGAGKMNLTSFEILKVLGRGSFGKVQLVKSRADGALYALKSMNKQRLQEEDVIEQTLSERNVLLELKHPFLVGAKCTFQTKDDVFIVLDYVPGGEMFTRLNVETKFEEERVRLYAAEIALGIGELHKRGYVYRDLKPENLLLDADGHVMITDFGLVKATMKTQTFCGTPEFIAPEMLEGRTYTKSVDWWSFGILVYQMLVGSVPFYDENTNRMYRKIMYNDFELPGYLSADARVLVQKLLDKNGERRLGSGPGDVEDVMKEAFFSSIDWDKVLERGYTPAWRPELRSIDDTGNFETEFTSEQPGFTPSNGPLLSQTNDQLAGFSVMNDAGGLRP